jgi:hypothetical protein
MEFTARERVNSDAENAEKTGWDNMGTGRGGRAFLHNEIGGRA